MFLDWRDCRICYLFLLILLVKVIHVPASCFPGQFSCANKKCVDSKFVCDDEDDCSDGSDELNCGKRPCLQTEYKCGNGRCILKRWKCDQYPDCKDGSDEKNCNTTCSADEFTCYNGICIPSSFHCDGENDCLTGEDEKNCTYITTCSPASVKCKNNVCIDRRYLCDGEDDCGDNTDEDNCGNTCKPGSFTCKSGNCIPGNLRCNGKKDCTDGLDEDQCPPADQPKCSKNQFTCADGECVLKSFKCDGENDCDDGSDELGCSGITCPPRHYLCDNNKCIMNYLVCDGKDDCGDKSDEKSENCSKTPTTVAPKELTCKVDEYKCKSLTKCIYDTKVCDQTKDCPDNDDESSCSIDECKINNGGCSQLCNDTDSSFYCSCKSGYKLVDSKTCEDIDECKIPGRCAQECKNKPGFFLCLCIEGYKLAPDGKRCLAEGKIPSLLVAVGVDIRRVSTDGFDLKSVVGNNVKDVVAVAVHYKRKVIFWSDLFLGKIFTATIEGDGKDAKVLATSVSPKGLSVDWVTEKLYWITVLPEGSMIEVAELDGSHHKVLISNIKGGAHTIVVHPLTGYIYWTNPSIPSISRAHMDGNNIEDVVKTNIQSPTGLTIDFTIDTLYWLDSKLHSIESSDLNGSNRRSVITRNVKNPFAIAVFEEKLYWTDSVSKTVTTINKFTGGDRRVVITHDDIPSYIPKGILIDHPLTQPNVTNRCIKNGMCSHLCLLNPSGYRCACPTNGVLSSNNKTCIISSSLPTKKSNIGTTSSSPTKKSNIGTTSSSPTKKYNIGTTSSSPTKKSDSGTTVKAETRKTSGESKGVNVTLICGVIGGFLTLLLILVVLFVLYRKRNNSRKMEIHYNTQHGVVIPSGDAKNPTQSKKDIKDRETYVKFANKNFDAQDDDDEEDNYGEKQPVLKRDDDEHVVSMV